MGMPWSSWHSFAPKDDRTTRCFSLVLEFGRVGRWVGEGEWLVGCVVCSGSAVGPGLCQPTYLHTCPPLPSPPPTYRLSAQSCMNKMFGNVAVVHASSVPGPQYRGVFGGF